MKKTNDDLIRENKLILEELLWGKMTATRKMHMRDILPLLLWCAFVLSLLALLINHFAKGFFPSIKSVLITIIVIGVTQIILENTYLVSFFLGEAGLFAWVLPTVIYAFFQHSYHDRSLSIFVAVILTALMVRPFINYCKKDEIQKRIDILYSLGIEATVPFKVVKYRELPK